MGNTFEIVKKHFKTLNVELLSTEYISAKSNLFFKCVKCGNKYHIRWDHAKNKKNRDLYVCPDCRKSPKVIFNQLKEIFKSKGVKLLSTSYKNAHTPIEFCCSKCGTASNITWSNFNNGANPNLLCKHCLLNIPKISDLKNLFASKGAVLLSEEYISTRSPLYFLCSECKGKHSISWLDIQKGLNKNFLCKSCLTKNYLTYKDISAIFNAKGAELISTEYKGVDSLISFKCSKCGKPATITISRMRAGHNPNLQCPSCNGKNIYTYSYVKELFDKAKVKLISKNYVNSVTPLEFSCTRCGDSGFITLQGIKNKFNPLFLCKKCGRGSVFRPDTFIPSLSSTELYCYSFDMCFRFFNMPLSLRKFYSAHHLIQKITNPDLVSSIPNIFPVPKEKHAPYWEFEGELYNLHVKHMENVENFPECLKLPFHNYEGFRFLDLNSKVINRFFASDSNLSKPDFLLSLKKDYHAQNKLFIPFYIDEYIDEAKFEIALSMLRSRLGKFYPDIYKYTNTPHRKFFARNLKIDFVPSKQAKEFFNSTHIQGFAPGQIYIGLYSDKELVSCMSFIKSRFSSNVEWELLRFSNLLNSSVVGAASKLFKFFVKTFQPNSVVSYCDIRFSSLNPEETVYPKLGFKFSHQSRPNYKYLDPVVNRSFSRIQFQKHLLKDKLEKFDENLSETQNMINNGYIKIYDCGNFVFTWTKEEHNEN